MPMMTDADAEINKELQGEIELQRETEAGMSFDDFLELVADLLPDNPNIGECESTESDFETGSGDFQEQESKKSNINFFPNSKSSRDEIANAFIDPKYKFPIDDIKNIERTQDGAIRFTLSSEKTTKYLEGLFSDILCFSSSQNFVKRDQKSELTIIEFSGEVAERFVEHVTSTERNVNRFRIMSK